MYKRRWIDTYFQLVFMAINYRKKQLFEKGKCEGCEYLEGGELICDIKDELNKCKYEDYLKWGEHECD